MGVTATQIGVIQSVREIPELQAFAIGFAVLWISEMRLIAITVLLMGLCIVIGDLSTGVDVLLVGTLVMSVGFHVFYPRSSVVLMGVGKGQAPSGWDGWAASRPLPRWWARWSCGLWWTACDWGRSPISAWGYRTTLYA